MAAKQLTFTKAQNTMRVSLTPTYAALWLGKGDDGQVGVKVHRPWNDRWSEPMTPDKAFRIIESWEETGNVCVIDEDDLWPATWPAFGSAESLSLRQWRTFYRSS